jgi:hypothetical protein
MYDDPAPSSTANGSRSHRILIKRYAENSSVDPLQAHPEAVAT